MKASIRALEMAALDPPRTSRRSWSAPSRPTTRSPPPRCCKAGWGNKKAFAFDVSAACAGSLYALAVADRFVASGAVKNALVVGVDTLTRITDWTDRNTCILFGDGAGAMVLKPSDDPRRGILTTRLHSDGSLVPILYQPGGGSASRSRRRSSARSRTT